MTFQKGHKSYAGSEKGWFKKGCNTWNKGLTKLANPELAFESSNLITLCLACHARVHVPALNQNRAEVRRSMAQEVMS